MVELLKCNADLLKVERESRAKVDNLRKELEQVQKDL